MGEREIIYLSLRCHHQNGIKMGSDESHFNGERRGGGGGIIYLSLHCHHQNDTCIKMGRHESHFNGEEKWEREGMEVSIHGA